MNTGLNKDFVDCSYSVYAVILGADETLLQIQLKDGFRFERLSLNPRVSHLDKVFDTTDFGLRRDYETARISSSDSLDVICAIKETTYSQPISSLDERFDNDTNSDLASLDNQIRIIRLLAECPLRFIKIAYHQYFRYRVDGQLYPGNHNAITPIGEAMTINPITKLHCNQEQATYITQKLYELNLPFNDALLNSCHIYYDMSYHTEQCVSITLLTTALEMLFLEEDVKCKKERLAKRCSSFLYMGDSLEIGLAYNELKSLYKKRSEFVHEGKASNITEEDIIALRGYVRNSLLKALLLSESKRQRINRLKSYIEKHGELFGE
ncbi:MAG: hypothetical protein IKG87_15105 [Clostridia bacterium]|nr:hypothetical protein [Clostridia bacterium]